MTLINLIVLVAVLGLVLWLFESLPVPEYAKIVARVFVILALIVWLLHMIGFNPHLNFR